MYLGLELRALVYFFSRQKKKKRKRGKKNTRLTTLPIMSIEDGGGIYGALEEKEVANNKKKKYAEFSFLQNNASNAGRHDGAQSSGNDGRNRDTGNVTSTGRRHLAQQ